MIIDCNHLSAFGATALVGCLRNHSNLISLEIDLYANKINNEGLDLFGEKVSQM